MHGRRHNPPRAQWVVRPEYEAALRRHRLHLRKAFEMTVHEAVAPAAGGAYTLAGYLHMLIQRDLHHGIETASPYGTHDALRYLEQLLALAAEAEI